MLIAVPTGVKVFNWVATMWKSAMTFETPMLLRLDSSFYLQWRLFGVDVGGDSGGFSVS